MLTSITVLSLLEAMARKEEFSGVLSLQDIAVKPGELLRFADPAAAKHLCLRFDDDKEDGPNSPQAAHMEAALAFARTVGGSFMVHCHAGISRSGAVGYALWSEKLGPGREDEALDRLLLQRPIAYPNLRMVGFADELLGRSGKLVDALMRRRKMDGYGFNLPILSRLRP